MEGQRRILDLCVDAGETLLANGAEIYRVQQTMEIIARSYGARSFHVYVLTNGLFASMEDGGAVQSAAVRSTPRVEMNLGRISAVNALSREIVAGRVPLEEAFARLAQIRATRGLPGWLMVSASAFSAACFCYLFGGSAVDAFTALAPGFAVGLFTRALARVRTPLNKLVSNMLSAGVVALVSLACVQALGLAGLADRHPMSLSGGQKQRVVVAVAMLSDKPLILLDEPTSGLDWGSMQQVGRLMQVLKAQGKTLLVITHDEELAAAWCDRVITLS